MGMKYFDAKKIIYSHFYILHNPVIDFSETFNKFNDL